MCESSILKKMLILKIKMLNFRYLPVCLFKILGYGDAGTLFVYYTRVRTYDTCMYKHSKKHGPEIQRFILNLVLSQSSRL